MPDYVADDAPAIAARMKQIQAEAEAAKPTCRTCDGVGWVRSAEAVPVVVFVSCPDCSNPLVRPMPCLP